MSLMGATPVGLHLMNSSVCAKYILKDELLKTSQPLESHTTLAKWDIMAFAYSLRCEKHFHD
jgi:hypothetical protein